MTEYTETWKPIARSEGRYEVSDHGRVRHAVTGSVLSCAPKANGYKQFNVKANGSRTTLAVHTEALEAFVGPKPEGHVARHFDGDKCNNHISNLEWGTYRQNVEDSRRHGTITRGSKVGRAKLDEWDAAYIKAVLGGERKWGLARKLSHVFGVGDSAIGSIKRGATWGHVEPLF